jgi:hypothetical protein
MRWGAETRYWFKPKRYGYGATPVTWEGWAVIGAAVAIVVVAFLLLLSDRGATGFANWIAFIAVLVITLAALSMLSARKTDGAWRWRWGNQSD